jgi:hypothetical protein
MADVICILRLLRKLLTPSPDLTCCHTKTEQQNAKHVGKKPHLLFSPLVDLAFERMVRDQVGAAERISKAKFKE